MFKKHQLSRKLAPIFGFIALLACLLTVAFHNLGATPAMAQDPAAAPQKDEKVDPNHVQVQITLLGFDIVKGELDARLIPIPNGNLKNEAGFPSADLQLTDIESVTKQQFDLKKNRPIESPVTKYVTSDGDPFFYPFDKYKTTLGFYIDKLPPQPEAPAPEPGKPAPAAAPANDAEVEAVSIEYEVSADLAGFNVDYKETPDSTEDYVELEFTITRALPSIAFSGIVFLIMWVLSLLIMTIAITVLKSGKMPETGVLVFSSVLLFAFPALRNTQPMVPPPGTLSDFCSFFWTESIVVIALLIIASCWIKRFNPPPAKP